MARECTEFGTKVSLTTTINEGFVIGMRAVQGDPHNRHTLP